VPREEQSDNYVTKQVKHELIRSDYALISRETGVVQIGPRKNYKYTLISANYDQEELTFRLNFFVVAAVRARVRVNAREESSE
jgi:hypothetical protein